MDGFERMILGVRSPATPEDEREIRRYYTVVAAHQKGLKRRARRVKAFLSKQIRKGLKQGKRS